MIKRPRRLRANALLRDMIAETTLRAEDFIYPYFVSPKNTGKSEVPSMPGIHIFGQSPFLTEVEKNLQLGINRILLFGSDETKDEGASHSCMHNNAVNTAIKNLRKNFGKDLYIITDVCLCAYTSHGHCGLIEKKEILNDDSLFLLGQMALSHADAGADMVAPSDMMDGRVGAIRDTLDDNGYTQLPIMSYSSKYASAYYGPFRDAAHSSPKWGDRSTYQMDYRNSRESLRELQLDEEEGADIIMVKPALAYLDIIQQVKSKTQLPIAAYNVSGEYAMVKAAAQMNWVDERKIVLENMTAMRRAGADIIISYHTKDIFKNKWLS